MVQLRDSHSAEENHDAKTHDTGFRRIFGIETEYGVSVTRTTTPLDPSAVAQEMFRPVFTAVGATNTYTRNGSRLYLDVGSHPEYATAETTRPRDATLVDAAGELTMRRLALTAQETLRQRSGNEATVHLYKNNTDSAGHSFGCHENYMVNRNTPLSALAGAFVTFLVTRTIYTGAGTWDANGTFRLSQRAPFLDEGVSSATTRSRPMINTRDEPLADSHFYRRLHVIVGDSNRSQTATWMKLATAHLMLCMIESDEQGGVERLVLADPGAAITTVAADPQALLDMADGTRMRAADIQEACCDAACAFLDRHEGEPGLDAEEMRRCTDRWRSAIADVRADAIDSLAMWVDWAAKLRLADSLRRRHPRLDAARLRQIDLDYHDVANGHVYESLLHHGQMTRLFSDTDAEHAVNEPPADTRAHVRGMFVARAVNSGASWSAEWTNLAVHAPIAASAELLDPFETTPDTRVEAVLSAL